MKKYPIFIILVLFAAFFLYSQDESESAAGNREDVAPVDQPVVSERVVPVFPEEYENLLIIEGEEAVSTNFNLEPTLLYGASGNQALQLSTIEVPPQNQGYFVDLLFYAPAAGTFEFWYGGTPPGPKEELYPSFSSPFQFSFDDSEFTAVYREDVNVVEGYMPAYYWVRVQSLELTEGNHKIRIKVDEKRRFDNRYYFNLDMIFLASTDHPEMVLAEAPEVFPMDMAERSKDHPFESISTYQQALEQNPDWIDGYLDLSLIFSLVGDYLNALKMLQFARLLEPENETAIILSAKNRIWKGEIDEGLRTYRDLLEQYPEQYDIWLEAGKIAAWMGRYAESEQFFRDGLSIFERDLDITVNMGLSYLWNSRNAEAEIRFAEALEIAGNDPEQLEHLAEVYWVNGYPEKAIDTYQIGIAQFPNELRFYLDLQNALQSLGREDEADSIDQLIADSFVASPRLSTYLEIAKQKRLLKEELIQQYTEELKLHPDNLELRRLLVQTYFWNGFKEKAVNENLNIIANLEYRGYTELNRVQQPNLQTINLIQIALIRLNLALSEISEAADFSKDLIKEYENSVRKKDQFLADMEKARVEGKEFSIPESGDPREILIDVQNRIADQLGRIRILEDVLDERILVLAELRQDVQSAVEHEREVQSTFLTLTENLAWEWNRNFTLDELESLSNQGNRLADYIIGRIYQFEGEYDLAESYLSDLKGALGDAGVFAFIENELRQNEISVLNETYQFDHEVFHNQYQALLDWNRMFDIDYAPALFLDSTISQLNQETAALTEMEPLIRTVLKESSDDMTILNRIVFQNLKRQMFHNQVNTSSTRIEIGNFYLAQEKMNEATAQLRHVLAVDPWNISVLNRLGNVRQLYGDWFGAMDYYRRVYQLDPGFENTLKNYNRLAKDNADSLGFNGRFYNDSGRISYGFDAGFSTHLNSVISWGLHYQGDGIALYGLNREPDQQLFDNSLILKVPLDFYEIGLKVTPSAGLRLSPVFNAIFVNEAQEQVYSLIERSDEKLDLDYYIVPHMGGEVQFGIDGISLTGGYQFSAIRDTQLNSRLWEYHHLAELHFNALLGFIPIPSPGYSSARLYGKTDFIGDGNMIGMALEELIFSFHLADAPWSSINIVQSTSFEHSLETASQYYAPQGVLITKLGAQYSAWFGIGNDDAIGLVIFGNLGGYWNNLTDSGNLTTSFLAEGKVRLEYSKGTSSYFIEGYGSGTFGEGFESEFWSVMVTLGYQAKLPEYLLP